MSRRASGSSPWADLTVLRLGVCGALGAAAGMAMGLSLGPSWPAVAAPLVGWIVTASVFCVWTWLLVQGMDAAAVRDHALREDAGRGVGDLVLLLACLAAVVGVGFLLLAGATSGTGSALEALVGVLGVVASWFVVHLLYMLRYARQHVADPQHGIDFAGGEPTYRDFAYLAYTIGMTYQVSDTAFRSRSFRSTALPHALLSYFLGAVVVACTINLVVQLASVH